MAESAGGQYEANPFFDRQLPEWARRAHLDGAFCVGPAREKFSFWLFIKSFIDQARDPEPGVNNLHALM